MKKNIIISLFVGTALALLMFFVALPGGAGGNYPDAITTTSYGFPMVFRTIESGGIAGTTNEAIAPLALVVDFAFIPIIVFTATFVITKYIRREHQKR